MPCALAPAERQADGIIGYIDKLMYAARQVHMHLALSTMRQCSTLVTPCILIPNGRSASLPLSLYSRKVVIAEYTIERYYASYRYAVFHFRHV